MAKNETKIEITAEDKTGPAFSSLSSRLLGLEQGFGKISGLIGGISAVTAVGFLTQAVRTSAQFADDLGDLSQVLGTTTESLSKLKYAAEIEGVFEPLQAGMTKLAKASEEFRKGSAGAIESFGKLQIDPSGFNDTAELFTVVADKLSKMEDGARKTAIAQELLGKSGAQLLPLINQGADGLQRYADEAERFGLVVSDDVAEAAGKFNDNLAKIEAAAKGATIQLGGPLVESLSKTSEAMVESITEGNKLFALLQGFAGLGKLPFDFFFSADSSVSSKSRVKDLEQEVVDLEQSIIRLQRAGGRGKANELLAGGSIDELQKKLAITKTQLEAFKKFSDQLDAKPAPKSKVEAAFTPAIVKSSSGTKSSGKSDAEKYAEEMAKLIGIFQDAAMPAQTVSEKLQDQLNAYTNIDPAIRAYAENLIAQKKAQEDAALSLDSLNEAIERNNEMMSSLQAFDDADQSTYKSNSETYDAILREAEDLNASLIENDKERARRQLEIENRRRLERIDLMEGEADQIDAIREAELDRQAAAFKLLEKQTSQSTNIGRDLGLTFSSAFEDSIVKGNELRDVVTGLGEDLIRIFARKTVTEPFAEAFSGFGSGIGDWFKSIIPNADGGVYSSPSLSAFSGSVVSSPTMFAFANGAGLMGEAGAEGIFPLKRGKDGKLGVEASGVGAGKVEYNVSVSVDATGGSVQGNNDKANDLGRQIEGAVRSVLLKEKRQGGMLA